MNTISEKRKYCIPHLACVKLDNEISLILVSVDPEDPYKTENLNAPEYFNNDPFKTNLG